MNRALRQGSENIVLAQGDNLSFQDEEINRVFFLSLNNKNFPSNMLDRPLPQTFRAILVHFNILHKVRNN